MTATPTFVVLAFDDVLLAVPRSDVRAVEAAADVDRAGAPQGGVGWISSEGARPPVYCFDADLRLVVAPGAARRVCVVLAPAPAAASMRGAFAVLCDDFHHLIARNVPLQALPPALAVAGSPLRGLLRLENGLACTTDAATLARGLPLPATVAAQAGAATGACAVAEVP